MDMDDEGTQVGERTVPGAERGCSEELMRVLGMAQERGFLGEGDLVRTVAHATGFADAAGIIPRCCLDLGSGGGIPGLVLAERWDSAKVALLDGRDTRGDFLAWAVAELGMGGRVEVVAERAEVAGRRDDMRGMFDAVVARGFGSPAVTAECAAPFLSVGGVLVVSEPPRSADGVVGPRWPGDGVADLGLVPGSVVEARFRYQVLEQRRECPPRFPRRTGVPQKRPLF